MRTSVLKGMSSVIAGVCLLPASAWAQAPAPAAPPAPPAPPAAQPAPAAPAPAAPAPAPAPEAAPPAPPAAEPAPAPVEPAAPPPPPPAAVAAPEPAPAAEEKAAPTPAITGFVEGAYHLNLSEKGQKSPTLAAPTLGSARVPLRVYDATAANSFLLHAAHLAIKHSLNENVSGVIEIDGGTDAGINSGFNGANGYGLFDVQEAYGSYTNSGFTFTAGKFVTYEGIEVIEGPSNPTITRGFLFGFAEPFTHIGAKAHYATGPIDIGVGIVNGWDLYIDNNSYKTGIFRVGVTPVQQFWAAVSGSYGIEAEDPRLSLDLTGAVIPSDMITINFQANYGMEKDVGIDGDDASWLGFGLQPVLTLDAFKLGARFEWFQDKGLSRTAAAVGVTAPDPAVPGAAPPDKASYMNFTITPGYTLAEAFTLRGEYRLDIADEKFFAGEKTQSTIALGAHYVF